MTCSQCAREYDSSVLTCPDCGLTLTYGAGNPPTIPTAVPPFVFGSAPQFDLTATVSVSGTASIRSRLRPRTVWEIIGEAFSLYWQNWKVFLPVSLMLYAPLFVAMFFFERAMNGASPSSPAGPEGILHRFTPVLVYIFTVSILSLVINFVLIRGVSNCYLNKPTSLSSVLKVNNRIWGFLGASLLAGLIEVAAGSVLMLPFVVGVVPHLHHLMHQRNPAEFLGALALGFGDAGLSFLALLALVVAFMAVAPAAVVEGRGAFDSLRRGLGLIRGFYWKGAGVLILASMIAGAIQQAFNMLSMCFLLPGMFKGIASSTAAHPVLNPMASMPDWAWAGYASIQWIGGSLAIPATMLMIVLFYYDLRIRKEAFDLQMLSEQLGYGVEDAA